MKIVVVFMIISLFIGIEKNIYNENKPVATIGIESESNQKAHIYKAIKHYFVNKRGEIYVGDIINCMFDKYDKNGKFIKSLGRKGQGPGELEVIASFVANEKNEIITYSNRRRFIILNENGSLKKEIEYPNEMKSDYPEKIKIDNLGNLYVLFISIRDGFKLVKFDQDFKQYKIIHNDKKRTALDNSGVSSLPSMLIDFDFDEDNNVYVTDSIDYKVYKYSSNAEHINNFEIKAKREKFSKRDMIMCIENNVINFLETNPNMLNELNKRNFYVPKIFGINIYKGKMYLWTTKQDNEYRYLIEKYDLKNNYLGNGYIYDYMPQKASDIKGGLIYIPDMKSGDKFMKEKAGRLSIFNIPFMLNVYELIEK